MLAHTSDEALLNTSSAVIIDTVIRTAVPFEEEPDHVALDAFDKLVREASPSSLPTTLIV